LPQPLLQHDDGAQPHDGSAAHAGAAAQVGAAAQAQVGSAAAQVASQHDGAQQLPPNIRFNRLKAFASDEATISVATATKGKITRDFMG